MSKAIYDNFAKQYSDAEGEMGDQIHQTQLDPFIYKVLGDVDGKTIYDIGCGNGYMARYFSKNGAKVYASDVSEKIIEEAKKRSKGFDITYTKNDATDFDEFKEGEFDAVVMNMVIHYIKDLDKLFAGVSKVLKPGGIFVFSNNHFMRPAYPYSDWVLGKIEGEEVLFNRVTGYLKKEKREVLSYWDNKTKMTTYNHPLNEFVNTLSKYKLFTFAIEEPESGDKFATAFPENLKRTHHIPTFIIIGATKK